MKVENKYFNIKEIVCIATDISYGMHYLHSAKNIYTGT